jgi:hypothetical protein
VTAVLLNLVTGGKGVRAALRSHAGRQRVPAQRKKCSRRACRARRAKFDWLAPAYMRHLRLVSQKEDVRPPLQMWLYETRVVNS